MMYLDSSALVKLLVTEPQSELAWDTLGSEVPCTCRVSYAEARAALARQEREGNNPELIAAARSNLASYWPQHRIIEVTQSLVEKAGELADAFGLRGYDAVQLAAAHQLAEVGGQPVRFLCFDRRLNRAAKVLGLALPEGVPQ